MNTHKTHDTSFGISRVALTLVLGGALAVLACATTRPIAEQVDDSNVTAAIANQYVMDAQIDRYRIDIDTLSGVVTLRGTVGNHDQRSDAARIAGSTDGVVKVVNKLEVDTTPRTTKASFEDKWIAVTIESKLAVDPEVRSRNVDVDVREGVVTLSGIVETETARIEAEDLAGSVDGVLKIVNELQIGA